MDNCCYGHSVYDDYNECDMKYDNCYCRGKGSRKDLLCVQVPNKKKNIKEEILFWGCGSIEHIEYILNSNKVFEMKIPSAIKSELMDLLEEFKKIVENFDCQRECDCECQGDCDCDADCDCKYDYDYDIYEVLRRFLCLNARLIKVLNRLMFEGYAGSAILFQTLNHFMIEQIYIARIFEFIEKSPSFVDERNVWGPNFYTKFGIGDCQLECAYVQMYFWNVLSAQHSSLLENSSLEFSSKLSLETFDRFEDFKKDFNDLNLQLGENFHKLNKSKWDCSILRRIAEDAYELNKIFIKFIWSLSTNAIGCELPECTPEAFFNLREHILYEQRYYNDILEKILAVLR